MAVARRTCEAATRNDRLLAITTAARLTRLGISSAAAATSEPHIIPALLATCMAASAPVRTLSGTYRLTSTWLTLVPGRSTIATSAVAR